MFVDKNGVVRKPVAYLADFEMFLPSCAETVKYWKSVCDKYGIIGLFPGDEEPDDGTIYQKKDDSFDEFWMGIFMHDVHMMNISDMVIAQLDDWRSFQPDSGTSFELGWFCGKGLPCYGFCKNATTMLERTGRDKNKEENTIRDQDGYAIEQREFPLDNMFSLVKVRETFEEACKQARADFDEQLIAHGYPPYQVKEGE